MWHLDEPTTDPSNLPFMLICEEARRFVKVALSGDGGDELLMGYDRFRASKAAALLSRLPLPNRQRLYQALIHRLGDNEVKKGARNVLKRFLQGAVTPGRRRASALAVLPRSAHGGERSSSPSCCARSRPILSLPCIAGPMRRPLSGAHVSSTWNSTPSSPTAC